MAVLAWEGTIPSFPYARASCGCYPLVICKCNCESTETISSYYFYLDTPSSGGVLHHTTLWGKMCDTQFPSKVTMMRALSQHQTWSMCSLIQLCRYFPTQYICSRTFTPVGRFSGMPQGGHDLAHAHVNAAETKRSHCAESNFSYDNKRTYWPPGHGIMAEHYQPTKLWPISALLTGPNKTGLSSKLILPIQLLFGGVVISLSTIFIIRLQWGPLASIGTYNSQSLSSNAREISTNAILHPEDHSWRGPEVREFTWTVTSASIRPDGVRRDVIHINSKPNRN